MFEDENSIVHIGKFKVFGFIIQEEVCSVCNSKKVYYDKHDAKFCPVCNIWLEKQCSDEGCDYCKVRPEKPLSLLKEGD